MKHKIKFNLNSGTMAGSLGCKLDYEELAEIVNKLTHENKTYTEAIISVLEKFDKLEDILSLTFYLGTHCEFGTNLEKTNTMMMESEKSH